MCIAGYFLNVSFNITASNAASSVILQMSMNVQMRMVDATLPAITLLVVTTAHATQATHFTCTKVSMVMTRLDRWRME